MKKDPNRQGFELPFHKIHGAGNDCLVFSADDVPAGVEKRALVRALSDRRLGIGSDQVLEILGRDPLAVQVWNCDGSQAEMCANGCRSFAMLADHEGWVASSAMRIPLKISGKDYECLRQRQGFELALGEPRIEGEAMLQQDGESIPCVKVSVGNPHAVIFASGAIGDWLPPANFDFRVWGELLERHREFPEKANIEFVRSMKIEGGQLTAHLEVWERGAGATLSCGSGAVAVAAAIRERYRGLEHFSLVMNQFTLHVRFEGEKAFLSGPSTLVAKGIFFFTL